ncbi:MAG: mannosyltransferase family protein [Chthoniobacterales bacterium]
MPPQAATPASGPSSFWKESRTDIWPVLVAFVASRVVIVGVMLLSQMVILRGRFWRPGGLLEVLSNWDGVYYLHIARHGYFYIPEMSSTIVFFPVYPLAVRLFSFIFHDFRVAAVVVANVALLLAALLLERLVRQDYGRRVSTAAVVFLMFSPVSFFFSSMYTESTFLLFAVAAFFAAVKRRWLLACICGLILSATRNIGFLIALPLFIEHLRQTWNRTAPISSLLHPRVLFIALVPGGLGLYMLYAYIRVNDALAFTRYQAHWNRNLVSPLHTLTHSGWLEPFYWWLFNGILAVAAILWVAGIFFRVRASYLVWTAMLTLSYLSTNTLEALPRYLSIAFPLFIVLGLISTRLSAAYESLLAGSVALLTMCTILFTMGYWMT